MDARDAAVKEVQTGAVLAGRYRVEGQLGAGGMGVVVAAQHVQLGQRVAIKYLPSIWMSDPDAVERFMREAWAAAQIKSPHVVRVSDVANLPSGAPFIVMEYLEGEDLSRLIGRHEQLPIAEICELILQVTEAIAEAHAIGIVHRDLKPSNIFCTRNLEGHRLAKVLDFGISKLTHDGFWKLGITTTRTALGSPTYMSPEQMHSAKEVDGRTDIWALGVILYELLAGRPPFVARSLPELAIQIATEDPPPLAAARSDVPAGLERIISRCLEKDREKRYPDVASFALALTDFAPLTASLHASRAQRALRGTTSSGAVPIVRPSQPSPSAGNAPSDRASSRPRLGPRDETPRGSSRPSARPSGKGPRANSDDEPSGEVATRAARGLAAAGSARPRVVEISERAGERTPAAARPRRKHPRAGLWITATVTAVALLLLAAVAVISLRQAPGPRPTQARGAGVETATSAAAKPTEPSANPAPPAKAAEKAGPGQPPR